MSDALNMSLDEIIQKNKRSSSSGRGRGGARSGPGPTRRFENRAANRPNPYSLPKAGDYGVYTDQVAAYAFPALPRAVGSIETGTKLYISNLDYGVSNDDIKELFSEVGDIKRYGVHYDRSGRSKGTADVVFSRRDHALAALKRYNNVQLDGKPMKIEIVGTNIEKPVTFPPAAQRMFGNPTGITQSARGRGGPAGRPQGGGRGQFRGRGRGRGRGDKLSATDLDADLEKYHQAAAMQIN